MDGSNSRIYKLAWNDASPFTVISVGGGLLEYPEQYPYLMLAPGERCEIWVDFSERTVGSELTLRSILFANLRHDDEKHAGWMILLIKFCRVNFR